MYFLVVCRSNFGKYSGLFTDTKGNEIEFIENIDPANKETVRDLKDRYGDIALCIANDIGDLISFISFHFHLSFAETMDVVDSLSLKVLPFEDFKTTLGQARYYSRLFHAARRKILSKEASHV